jgi:glycosyltransferase involved in cell wall biosynthesis
VRLRATVSGICTEPQQLRAKSEAARARVRDLFTWDVKARQIIEVYDWARTRHGKKPEFFLESLTPVT